MVADTIKLQVKRIRKLSSYAAKFILVIPHFLKVRPTLICALTIITTTIAMILHNHKYLFFLFLILTLLLSFFDRFVIRKHYSYDESNRICALVSDRISEGLLFTLFFSPWFFLFTLNCFLMLFGYVRKYSITLPLKEVFLIYYLLFIF